MSQGLLLLVSSFSGLARPEKATFAQACRGNSGAFSRTARRTLGALFVFALVLTNHFFIQAQTVQPQPKQVMPLRVAEVTEGSRVTITADVSLADYQTFTADNRFYVLIPRAAFSSTVETLRGRGFADARSLRRGEDLLLSFQLTANTTAHVSQKFNRLDVIFNVAGEEEQQMRTASVALTASDALPPPQTGEDAKRVVGKSINLPPEKAQPVRAVRFEKPPAIDGKLDEEVWKSAAVFKDFYQFRPGDNIAPSQPTEVLMGYDDKFLYFAFRAHDEAGKVRATIAKRDQIFDDDTVGMYLDTFNDQRRAFIMIFNPFGIQADGIFTEDQGEDYSFDLVMESKGAVTNDGFTVEVAIPFKSLRYEAGKGKQWGVHFLRQIKRINNETDSWMPISREKSGLLSQAGHITGLEGISTERTLELIPSLTISETGRRVPSFSPPVGVPDPGRIVNQPIEFDPGLTLKYGITPTVTLDLALNPDFAQVEADQTVVTANQRFPIFFEEKRPFFLEGIDIFRTPITAVHTRAIVDPDAAVKLTGKRGKNTFGLLLASDNAPGNLSSDERAEIGVCRERRLLDPSLFFDCGDERFLDKNAYIGVLRLKRDIGRENSLGLLATTYNFIEQHNHLGGFDGRFRTDPQTVITFQALATHSRRFFFEPDQGENIYRTGNAFAYAFRYDKQGRHFGYNYDAQGRTQDYRADVGFTRRNNNNRHGLFVYYNTEPQPKATLISKHFHILPEIQFDWQGRIQSWGHETQTELSFKNQTYLGGGVSFNYERIFEEEFGATRNAAALRCFSEEELLANPTLHCGFAGDDNERSTMRNNVYLYGGTRPSKKYSFSFFTIHNWGAFDFDFGAGPKFPRVSPLALLNPDAAPQDPGKGNQFRFEGSANYQPTDELRISLDYVKDRLVRRDTGLVAFDDNIFTLRGLYQFTRFTFARARIDYDTLAASVRGQFLLGWAPNPGTSFYVGYNDDMNYNGFTDGRIVPGFRRNGRTFFIKMSYLFRRSFGSK
ncbi:MAG TPA: DUF5916 domain-containing protein [Pyrinomonadaceae bacterium]|jgi:hypothetical protein